MMKCQECGIEKDVWRFKGQGFFCKKHYHEMYHYGAIRNMRGLKYKNEFNVKENHAEMILRNGQVALIDIEDIERLKNRNWAPNSQGYLHSRINGRLVRLHLYLMDFPKGIVDHKNRNKLDNRKENLRVCTQGENTKNVGIKKNNTSGFPGVNKIKTTGKWRARIMVNRKEIQLGHFDDFKEAVEARKAAELKYFGEFSPNKDL